MTLSPRFEEALAWAAALHREQVRKGTGIPYVAHLLGVASLVLEAGGDEDLAIAALLHDAAEDHGGEARLSDIAARFGGRVADVVRGCSDSLTGEGVAKEGWEERKRAHLARLVDAPDDVLVVWTADKVHNGRAILTDLAVEGPRAMDRFHAPPDRILWYYASNLALVEDRTVPARLRVALAAVVQELTRRLG